MASENGNRSLRRLRLLKRRYPSSSWAVWSTRFPDADCPEESPEEFQQFIEAEMGSLRPDVVLLSLNPSGDPPSYFLNFHSTNSKHFDTRLREFVEESGLEGAYMTDLVMDTIDPDSKRVDPDRLDVLVFLNQLNLLDQTEYHVICFHEKGYRALKRHFDAESTQIEHNIKTFSAAWNQTCIHVYRVWFFGNWGANKDKIPELRDQLRYLNDRTRPVSERSRI